MRSSNSPGKEEGKKENETKGKGEDLKEMREWKERTEQKGRKKERKRQKERNKIEWSGIYGKEKNMCNKKQNCLVCYQEG